MMRISVSASRLACWLECQQAYVGKYLFKLPDVGHPKTRLGSAIHDVLECISNPTKQDKRKKYILYSKETNKIHPTVWRFFRGQLKKQDVPELHIVPKETINLHELGITLLVDAFKMGYDTKHRVLDVEKRFDIPVSENVYIKGFIDKIVELDSDTIELTDYKSGKPFSFNACQKEFQPYFYKFAARRLYPQYKNIIFNFHFLKNQKIIGANKSDEEVEHFVRYVVIPEGMAMLKVSQESAIYTKGWNCNYCVAKDPNKEKNYPGCKAFYDKDGKYLFKN